MPPLPLLLAAAPQPQLPPAPPTNGALYRNPTMWVRTGAAPDAGGSCSPLANGGFHDGLFAWEADVSPCCGRFNLTNGIRISFVD